MLGFNTPKLGNKLCGQAVELSDMLFAALLKSVQKATTAQTWSSLETWLGEQHLQLPVLAFVGYMSFP